MMIAVIPARGGSKRIPKKNIRDFNGLPMIAHTIKEIQRSGCFERTIVSTEDLEIAKISSSAGAEIIPRRPELASDFATTVEVVSETVDQIKDTIDLDKELVCCVYPVTPRIFPEYILRAKQLLIEDSLDYVYTAKRFQSSPARSLIKGVDGKAEMYFPEYLTTRTQDLPDFFHDAALFYLGSARTWIEGKQILVGNSKFIELGKFDSIDVDDEEDWHFMQEVFNIRTNIREY
jgi:pseudaminic acid cytidylyltransferase